MSAVQSYEETYAAAWRSEGRKKRRDKALLPVNVQRKINILKLMRDGRERTKDDVARKLGAKNAELIRPVLTELVGQGFLEREESHKCALFRLKQGALAS